MLEKTSRAVGLLALVAGMLLAGTGRSQAQNAPRVFRCLQGAGQSQVLDFAAIREQFAGGQVTVRAHLGEGGTVANAEILQEALRSGTEKFWSTVATIIGTWRYSPEAYTLPSYIDYTVILPRPNELGSGTLEISTANLVLKPGWTVNIDRPEDLANYAGLARTDVVLTSFPPNVRPMVTGLISSTIENLRGFKWVFLVLAIFSGIVLIVGAVRVLYPWYPGGIKAVRPLSGQLQFGKEPKIIAELRELWVSGIEGSRLGEPDELPFGVDDLDGLQKLVDARDRQSFLEVLKTVESNPLLLPSEVEEWRKMLASESTGKEVEELRQRLQAEVEKKPAEKRKLYEKMLSVASGLDDLRELAAELGVPVKKAERRAKDEVLEEVKATLAERLRLAKKVLLRTPGTILSQTEKAEIQNMLWELFGKSRVEEALRRVRRYLTGNGGKPARAADLFRVFESGLQNHLVNENREVASNEIDRAIDRTLGVIVDNRKAALEWLWALGGLSPLLGLFGTVWGISQAFGKIHRIQNMKHVLHSLAGEINVALATTIVGLVIAVILVIFYYGLKTRADADALAIDTYFTEITNRV